VIEPLKDFKIVTNENCLLNVFPKQKLFKLLTLIIKEKVVIFFMQFNVNYDSTFSKDST